MFFSLTLLFLIFFVSIFFKVYSMFYLVIFFEVFSLLKTFFLLFLLKKTLLILYLFLAFLVLEASLKFTFIVLFSRGSGGDSFLV